MRYKELVEVADPGPTTRLRIHNSVAPLQALNRTASYPQHDGRKPNGLWWSFNQDWHDLVTVLKSKGKRVGRSNYRVEIDPDACYLLTLATWVDILDFTVKYAAVRSDVGFDWQKGDRSRYDPAQDDWLVAHNRCRVGKIAWGDVAKDYDGIELPSFKHLDPSRPQAEWLDIDWHVASGCAWRLAGVRLFTLR